MAKTVTAAATGEERFKAYVGLLQGLLNFHAQAYVKEALAGANSNADENQQVGLQLRAVLSSQAQPVAGAKPKAFLWAGLSRCCNCLTVGGVQRPFPMPTA